MAFEQTAGTPCLFIIMEKINLAAQANAAISMGFKVSSVVQAQGRQQQI